MAKIDFQPTDHQSSAAATLSPTKKPVNRGIEKSPINAPLDPNYKNTCNKALTDPKTGTLHEVPNKDSRSNQERDAYTPINGPLVTYTLRSLENLVPLGYFGPFPNNNMKFSFTSN
ncbi:unnamed protein product [Lactuca saligna]|uniref:Uncharacterized protein n=1 Tax=Lactuca saligna TaxID=75948 RepID=A0AA35Y9J8_LACSI|nr:unnamed protein product [Lactuca saligna]